MSNISSANQWGNDSHPFFINLQELREAQSLLKRATEVFIPSLGQTPQTVDLTLPTMQLCQSPLELLCARLDKMPHKPQKTSTVYTVRLILPVTCRFNFIQVIIRLLLTTSYSQSGVCVCVHVRTEVCIAVQARIESLTLTFYPVIFVTSIFNKHWLKTTG